MSKNTDTIRKLAAGIKVDPTTVTENTGFILEHCADEIDRLREALEQVRLKMVFAMPFLSQACQVAGHATDPENFEI